MKSLHLFNSSFNSSGELNASLGAGDLTNISLGTGIAVDTSNEPSELWRRRQQNFNRPNSSNFKKNADTIAKAYSSNGAFDEKLSSWRLLSARK